MKLKTFTLLLAGAAVLPGQTPPMLHGMPFGGMDHMVSNTQIKGAPYSGQEVTESTQTLADGSHIKRTTTTQIYRDSEGRVRLERTMTPPGGAAQKSITIIDPVAGAQFQIDPQAKTARKMNFHARSSSQSRSGAAPQIHERFATPGFRNDGSAQSVADALGHQSFSGVDAEGTRTTMTIAPNTIGNDAPIQVVTERWYSSELHLLLMSRHMDPRVGETVYRLTNISRTNPDAALFQVAPDVQVSESSRPGGVRGPMGHPSPHQ